jgi:hypothetical protein
VGPGLVGVGKVPPGTVLVGVGTVAAGTVEPASGSVLEAWAIVVSVAGAVLIGPVTVVEVDGVVVEVPAVHVCPHVISTFDTHSSLHEVSQQNGSMLQICVTQLLHDGSSASPLWQGSCGHGVQGSPHASPASATHPSSHSCRQQLALPSHIASTHGLSERLSATPSTHTSCEPHASCSPMGT